MKKIHDFDEVFDAQKMFRLVLTALSSPGKTVDIARFSGKMYGTRPAFLAVAMTLLDNEVSFDAGPDEALAGEIVSLTLAKRAPLDGADFIFVSGPADLRAAVENAKCGTLRDPHTSATIVMNIDDGRDAILRLSGPGIRDVIEIRTSPAVQAALELRDAQFYEYPQGIDFIFVSAAGGLFAVPRLTRREG
ncbi:phosphonate C-P lyase system protein PhnH [Sporobacter termitidis DSM 10068]|uniref:Phosphonate C-P lyase system protein PhnH n=1 Tax=Sporobacter termitidis DSM 10068 TaxID=1123282 RepID=A0A1M5Z8I0_9FIRM|nr:phosphonate C-P lyase system protein PhnH [Sporobacter termitidis]SHI20213.1 phosphonate C-P lyase system protein PhnH [Sporobacter termitidis DSM 10068]